MWRRALAIFAVFGLMLVALVATPSAAYAAPNSDIVVGNVTITPDDPATVGDKLTVSGEWDASEANPKEGDTFTIGLPPELGFTEAVPFNLEGAEGEVWATCLTDPTTHIATCELTDEVTANPESVLGTWKFEVEAIKTTTEEEVVFDLNGEPTLVDLPGEGGIDDGIVLPDEVSKSGEMNGNNWSMTWTVNVPGANMAGQDTVTLKDTLGEGHMLCSPTGLKVQTVRGDVVTDVPESLFTKPVAGATEFDIVLTAPEGGFNPDVTYRITYQTCTLDGEIDPEGTVYSNSAQIEGWGDQGQGIGTVTNKPWHVGLTKSGTVLGGGERNGKIAWTVTVPGSQLVGKSGFDFTETLGKGHNVCTDTISGIKITERYGPTNQRDEIITRLLDQTIVSSGAGAFKLRFDINGVDPAFAFKDSDHRYIITYTTCVTDENLPEGGTVYTNSVNVDGEIQTGTAKVPGRTKGKSGTINKAVVEIDGVKHMPQTTINWTITIPGELIKNIDNKVELTDLFTKDALIPPTHEVCVAGDPTGGLAARLRLKVEARDQIGSGGLTTVDLTDSTTVVPSGTGVKFDIAATDLPLPTNPATLSDGFTEEYQYVVTYTTCTVSGGMDAPGTAYSNAVTGEGINFTTTTKQKNSGSGTGQGVTRGSISINKDLADTTGAAFVPAGTMFTVHVKEIAPAPSDFVEEYDLKVPLDGTPVSGLNARGKGWTVELTEPTFPNVPGVVFSAPEFAETTGVIVTDGGTTATAEITHGTNLSVTLTNTAELGALAIRKELVGGAADLVDPNLGYVVTAKIDTSALPGVPAEADREIVVKAGETEYLYDLPIGATVTFTEVVPANDDTLTWGAPVFSPSSIVVSSEYAQGGEADFVSLTNSVERSVGTFSLVKSVTGEQAGNPAVPATVDVTATWSVDGNEQSKVLTIPTDGTPVAFGENLLVGTKVTLTETPLADGSSIAWGAPVWSGTNVSTDGLSAVVTIGRDAAASVSLENHAATSTAGISILKGIAGEAAGEVDANTAFPVTATWTDAEGISQSKDITINAVEPTPLGVELPAGTVVTITEGAQPGFDTVVWGSITISGEGVEDAGNGSATVIVSDQHDAVTLVTVVNEATWAAGTFSIAKSIAGILVDDVDVPESVTVIAEWVEGDETHSAEMVVPTDGSTVTFSQDLPHDTVVTLTEVITDTSARFTWAKPTWSGDRVVGEEGVSTTVTIGAADVAEVSLVNTAVESLGDFTLTKSLTGSGAEKAAGTKFPVTLTWTDLMGEEQTLEAELVAGQPVVLEGMPIGTEVRVEEHAAKLADNLRWDGATWSSTDENVVLTTEAKSPVATIVVTAEPGTGVEVSLENDIVVEDELVVSGMNPLAVWVLSGAALVFMISGAVLLRIRRRSQS